MKAKIVSNNSVVIHPLQNPPLCSSTDMPAVIDMGEEGANEDDSSLVSRTSPLSNDFLLKYLDLHFHSQTTGLSRCL